MIPSGFVSICRAYHKFRERDAVEASGRLAHLLCVGDLQASYFDSRGKEHKLPGKFWQESTDSIRQDIFNKGEVNFRKNATSLPEDTHVVVRDKDLSAILPSLNNSVISTAAGTAKKGGRPPKFDWDAIWTGIVWIGFEEGLVGKSQDEIIGLVQDWYEKLFGKDSAPNRSTLQPKIAKVLAVLTGEEPSIVFQVSSKRRPARRRK